MPLIFSGAYMHHVLSRRTRREEAARKHAPGDPRRAMESVGRRRRGALPLTLLAMAMAAAAAPLVAHAQGWSWRGSRASKQRCLKQEVRVACCCCTSAPRTWRPWLTIVRCATVCRADLDAPTFTKVGDGRCLTSDGVTPPSCLKRKHKTAEGCRYARPSCHPAVS